MKKTLPCLSLLFILSMIVSTAGCTSASTPTPVEENAPQLTADTGSLTIIEAEKISGFDIPEPAYLPTGVSFDFASYQETPSPMVTTQFKLVHEQYGDMGRFLQITQEPQSEAPADVISCGEKTEGCEIVEVGDLQVVYHLYSSEAEGITTEGLDWYSNGYVYRLLRTAGEPNKVYKEELVKIVESMQ